MEQKKLGPWHPTKPEESEVKVFELTHQRYGVLATDIVLQTGERLIRLQQYALQGVNIELTPEEWRQVCEWMLPRV